MGGNDKAGALGWINFKSCEYFKKFPVTFSEKFRAVGWISDYYGNRAFMPSPRPECT
jgi:hypothetical protein